MMEAKTGRYQSRILREMHQNKENPFNSPPSSTGSHGTVTMTSNFSLDPEGESTRRHEQDSIRLPAASTKHARNTSRLSPYKINTSVLGRTFPEWKGWDPKMPEHTEDLYDITNDHVMQNMDAKENIPPPSSSTIASPTEARQREMNKSPTPSKSRRGNVTALLRTLKDAQDKEAAVRSASRSPVSERQSPRQHMEAERPTSRALFQDDFAATPNQTARSFFLPSLAHVNDLVSGVLKFSSMKNGIPVFVKHGKVHDRESRRSPEFHAEVDAIEVPEDEEKIFVSMDKIREEIHALQEHDDQITRQAQQFQDEIDDLHVQLAKSRSRKDSALGSESDSSMIDSLNAQKAELEEQVLSLQARLEQANRKISINEIHTETYVTERDEAQRTTTRLQSQLDAIKEQGGDRHVLEAEVESLRDENNALRRQYKSLHEENQSLRSHNILVKEQNTDLQAELQTVQEEAELLRSELDNLQQEYEELQQENNMLKQDNASLERHNDKFFNDNKALQQKYSALERRVHDLQDNNARLHQLLESTSGETGNMTSDVKDIKDRLEKLNQDLAEENLQLHQQVIEIQSEFTKKKIVHEQEYQRLLTFNERLHDQMDKISKEFEQLVHDTTEEAVRSQTKHTTLTQELHHVTNQKSVLAEQLRESADQESTLQNELRRRMQTIRETRQVTEELQQFANNSRVKPAKVTRIVDPATGKTKSVASEISGRNTTSNTDFTVEEDYTQQVDLTKDTDFAGNFNFRDIPKAQDAEKDAAKDQPSPSRGQLFGILKNGQASRLTTQTQKSTVNTRETDLTGRFSVKSGLSGMSLPSQVTRSDISQLRRNADSAQLNIDDDHEDPSALFIDDITLMKQRQAANKEKAKVKAAKAVPALTTDAKRVLDGLCHDHDCRNCIICTRVKSHRHEDDVTEEYGKKRTVRVARPIPVTDRIPNPVGTDAEYEDGPTMRPARSPGVALASLLKSLQDEAAHIKADLDRKQAVYSTYDVSYDSRGRKALSTNIVRLMKHLEVKNDQIYALYDVLEGQKAAGQEMTKDELEITVQSIMSKDETWNGFLDMGE